MSTRQHWSKKQCTFFTWGGVNFTIFLIPELLNLQHVYGLKPNAYKATLRRRFHRRLQGVTYIMKKLARVVLVSPLQLFVQATKNAMSSPPYRSGKKARERRLLYIPSEKHFGEYADTLLARSVHGNTFYGNLFSRLRRDGYTIYGALEAKRSYSKLFGGNQTHAETYVREENFVRMSDVVAYIACLMRVFARLPRFPFVFPVHRLYVANHLLALPSYICSYRQYARMLKDLQIDLVFTLDHKYGKGSLLLAAKTRSIPTFTFQHAARAKSPRRFELACHKYVPADDISLPDHIFVSGTNDKHLCVTHGIPSERVHVTGMPGMDSYRRYAAVLPPFPSRHDPSRLQLLWFTCQTIYRPDDVTLLFFRDLVKMRPDLLLTIKFHPSERESERQFYRDAFAPWVKEGRVRIVDRGENPPLIQVADLVLVENQSTTAFEALLLGIPTILFNFKERWELTDTEIQKLFRGTAYPYCFSPEEVIDWLSPARMETLHVQTRTRRTSTLQRYFHNEDFAATERIYSIITQTLQMTPGHDEAAKHTDNTPQTV